MLIMCLRDKARSCGTKALELVSEALLAAERGLTKGEAEGFVLQETLFFYARRYLHESGPLVCWWGASKYKPRRFNNRAALASRWLNIPLFGSRRPEGSAAKSKKEAGVAWAERRRSNQEQMFDTKG